MFLLRSENMGWFIIGCVLLLHFQVSKSLVFYELPGRLNPTLLVYRGNFRAETVNASVISNGAVDDRRIVKEVAMSPGVSESVTGSVTPRPPTSSSSSTQRIRPPTSSSSSTQRIRSPIASSSTTQKIHLDVYFESNCPDSQRFITGQLTPTYRDLKDILEVRLIPFGKATAFFDEYSNTYRFSCQHGPPECYGNTVQGCSMSFNPDVETHLNFIDCMMSYPRPSSSGEKCARRLSTNWNPISKCANGVEGQRILFRNGQLTKSLQPPLNFVPWININGVHSDVIQNRALRNLRSVVCEAYKAPHPKC